MGGKRISTKYRGVFYRTIKRTGGKGNEKSYIVIFKRQGKNIETSVGRQYRDNMTPAKASLLRGAMIENRLKTRAEKKKELSRKKTIWTVDKLFSLYIQSRPEGKARYVDTGRYENYLQAPFGILEPQEIEPLKVELFKQKLQERLMPQTVKHILNLLTWVVNFGAKNGLCKGLSFHIQKPVVNNETTEDLSPAQIKRLIYEIDRYPDIQIANIMRMALFCGMRKGEILKLKWEHVNFNRGFIRLVSPKGGIDQEIPLNNKVRELLEKHPKISKYVFPGPGGGQRKTCKGANKIKELAGLPKDFRPLHGLRHVFASMVASSGAGSFILQKLLTHKDGRMSARYVHLKENPLKETSDKVGKIIDDIVNI